MPMLVTESGRVIVSKLPHSAKAKLSTFWMFSPSVTSFKEEQFRNSHLSTFVRPLPSVADSRLAQLENAEMPRLVTESGMVMLVIPVL